MPDFDELLQRKLEDLEEGDSPVKTIKSLPGEAADLEPLIYLAATLREMPYPELGTESSRYMQKELVKAARGAMKLPMRKRTPSLAWMLTPGFASLTLVFLGMLVIFFGARAWLAGPTPARTALLSQVTGQVQVADRTGIAWNNVQAGASLRTAQVVRTLADSSAKLVFFDGTQTTLAPNTALVLDEVAGGWGTVLRVKLTQKYGFTDHLVVPFGEKNGHFMVNTPEGAASVLGTAFTVAVDPKGISYFSVETGKVQVENAQGGVTLAPGFGTAVLLSQSPQPPAFTFTLTDTLTISDGGTWRVGGVPFGINADTFLLEQLKPGELVEVTGRILGSGQWVVDTIQPANEAGKKSIFTGVVQELGSEIWNVNGISIQVDLTTRLSGTIQVGDVVEVKYVILDSGPWRALEIVNLYAEGTPSQKATLTSAPSPSEELAPEVVVSPAPERGENCSSEEPNPQAVTLADYYGVKPSVIMDWFCQGFGFGEIDQAYSLSASSGVSVAQIFAERKSGQGWSEIKRNHPPKPENNNKPANQNNPANEVRQPTKTPKK